MATTTVRRSVRAAASRRKRAAREEIKRGVKHLEKSIGEIQKGLRKAEQLIEADARTRIRALQRDARRQLTAVKGRHRDLVRLLEKVSGAAEGSWQQVKDAADAALAEAVGRATSLVKRMKQALPR